MMGFGKYILSVIRIDIEITGVFKPRHSSVSRDLLQQNSVFTTLFFRITKASVAMGHQGSRNQLLECRKIAFTPIRPVKRSPLKEKLKLIREAEGIRHCCVQVFELAFQTLRMIQVVVAPLAHHIATS